MANIQKNFIQGKMNKSVDERLIPNGQYIDALNVRLGSTEASEIGSVENSKGNTKITSLEFNDEALSSDARCIGAYSDGSEETIYFFVHDPTFGGSPTGKLDLIVSYDEQSNTTTYHCISLKEGATGTNTTLNFNPSFLISNVDKIEDLLFFTDNTNPPRFINVTRNYDNPFNLIDVFTAESLLVIKKPPTFSPPISLYTAGDNNYLEDKLLCFAYRYEYEDNDFSATSQWSKPAFIPKGFRFGSDDYLNNGMENGRNGVTVTFNTGSELVTAVEVLFKESNGTILNIIDKFSKEEFGYADNQDVDIQFDSNQIFTVLNLDQLGRLYDAVPLKSKAQTLIGNRLIYGNYFEGYNLKDVNGERLNLDYSTSLVSKSIGLEDLTEALSDSVYTIDGTRTISNSLVSIDLTGANLIKGGQITLDITFTHNSFSGSPVPGAEIADITIAFAFTLPTNYSSVGSLVNSVEFQDILSATVANNKSVVTACTGTTWTDTFNCEMPNSLDTFFAYTSGISSTVYPAVGPILASEVNNNLVLQFPAMQWSNTDPALGTPTNIVTEYFSVLIAQATYQEISSTESLHSDRDYAVGIVYMDDFSRASTALLAPNSTVYVPCGNSDTKNSITIDLPINMLPPFWAKRYKFVLKPSATIYETIYCNVFFADPNSNATFFLLEGENNEKISEGQRLKVKRDTSGALQNCSYATVLEKANQAKGFIKFPSQYSADDVDAPAGTYAKIVASDFSIVIDEDAVKNAENEQCTDTANFSPFATVGVNTFDSNTSAYIDYTIPAGSRINLNFRFKRRGTGDGNNSCERRIYELDLKLVSTATYANFQDWYFGDNVQLRLDDGQWEGGNGAGEPNNTQVNSSTNSFSGQPNLVQAGLTQSFLDNNQYKFVRSSTDNGLWLCARGTTSCSGVFQKEKRRSCTRITVEVFRAEDTIIFESEPLNALDDVFYEGDQSYPIVAATGLHGGGTNAQIITGNRTQTSVLSGIIKTTLFDCYAFGNGAESFKIRDSIGGQQLQTGNRAITVSNQDYRESHRFADLTYSGRYSDVSNINRLNEFNFSTLNFKILEDSFGPINKLFGRETDVLVLQEDKISYVLAGKNLLSDSAGGGSVASIPEILGTQIARKEVYGISDNPESFVCYGTDKYFTDSKRGAVLQLRGTSLQNEQLTVISESGMRGWFRDLFIDSFATQKLGGYDPYMNEYVLSNNCIALPQTARIENCGITTQFNLLKPAAPQTFTVELGQQVGVVTLSWLAAIIASGTTWTVTAVYDGVTYTSGPVTTAAQLTFDKNSINVTTAIITVSAQSGDVANLNLTVSCPAAVQLTVKTIVITGDTNVGQFINSYYNFTDGTFQSVTTSQLVEFASGGSPIVSSFVEVTGGQGTSTIPTNLSTVQLGVFKKPNNDFIFSVADNKFGYLRSSTNYQNNDANINALVTAITAANQFLTTNVTLAPQKYFGEFTLPDVADDFLYLVYDLRAPLKLRMFTSPNSAVDACCNGLVVNYYIDTNDFNTATAIYIDSDLTTVAPSGYYVFNNASRSYLGGVMGSISPCQSCNETCTLQPFQLANQGSYAIPAVAGIYSLTLSTGALIGLIRGFLSDLTNKAVGIQIVSNSTIFNDWSQLDTGYKQTANNDSAWLGDSSVGPAGGTTYTNQNVYTWNGTAWATLSTAGYAVNGTTNYNATQGANSLCPIPKTQAGQTPTTITILNPLGVAFEFALQCPQVLVGIPYNSTPYPNPVDACNATGTSQLGYSSGFLTNANEFTQWGFAYTTTFGTSPIGVGYYKINDSTSNGYMQVDNNGVIIDVGTCPP